MITFNEDLLIKAKDPGNSDSRAPSAAPSAAFSEFTTASQRIGRKRGHSRIVTPEKPGLKTILPQRSGSGSVGLGRATANWAANCGDVIEQIDLTWSPEPIKPRDAEHSTSQRPGSSHLSHGSAEEFDMVQLRDADRQLCPPGGKSDASASKQDTSAETGHAFTTEDLDVNLSEPPTDESEPDELKIKMEKEDVDVDATPTAPARYKGKGKAPAKADDDDLIPVARRKANTKDKTAPIARRTRRQKKR